MKLSKKKHITQEELKEVLDYNPDTGVLTWKVNISFRCKPGDVAGCIESRKHTKYLRLACKGRLYYAHRLAFLYMTGTLPEIVDHIDFNGLNNCWSNLRAATPRQSRLHTRGTSNTGVKGVYLIRGKYKVQPRIEGKNRHLGSFTSIEEAKQVHDNFMKHIAGEFFQG